MDRRRYAFVGVGSRSRFYMNALMGSYAERSAIVGICDSNQHRAKLAAAKVESSGASCSPVCYSPEGFVEMLRREKVDTVIVTSIDRTHHQYILSALEMGCEVICEKPLTMTEGRVQALLEATNKYGRHVTVTFNYRFSPRNAALAAAIRSGAIGEVQSVHFEWVLDTRHGADYFRRWHRDRANSGGLMVHKASHHMDLASWWVGSRPERVFGFGGLRFYGRENAERRGIRRIGFRGTGHVGDPFAIDLASDPDMRELYLEAEGEDGYLRDQGVFSDGITIEDDMAVLVRYRSGATMSYHLTAYGPWEGYRVSVNGTGGRLELEVVETAATIGRDAEDIGPEPPSPGFEINEVPGPQEGTSLWWRPLWRPPVSLKVPEGGGGHGGGDPKLLETLFGDAPADPMGFRADEIDGAYAALTGIAANRSFVTGSAIALTDLVPGALLEDW